MHLLLLLLVCDFIVIKTDKYKIDSRSLWYISFFSISVDIKNLYLFFNVIKILNRERRKESIQILYSRKIKKSRTGINAMPF